MTVTKKTSLKVIVVLFLLLMSFGGFAQHIENKTSEEQTLIQEHLKKMTEQKKEQALQEAQFRAKVEKQKMLKELKSQTSEQIEE